MPKIERYNSTQRLSTDAPQVQKSLDVAGSAGNQIAQVGGAVADVSLEVINRYNQANNLRQSMEAELRANRELNELKEQVSFADVNDEIREQYESKAKNILSKATSTIKDKNTRLKFESQYGLIFQNSIHEMRKNIRKKDLDAIIGVANQKIEDLKQDYYAVDDPKQKQIFSNEIQSTLDRLVESGAITREKMSKQLDELDEELSTNQVYVDFEKNPDQTVSELRAGQSGKYGYLEPEKRGKIEKELNSLKEKRSQEQEKAFKIAENETERDVAVRATKDDVTKEELDALLKGFTDEEGNPRRISQTFYDSQVKALVTPYDDKRISSVEKLNKYDEIVSEYQKLNRPFDGTGIFEKKYGSADENSIEQIQAFRKLVSDNVRYLTRAQAEAFYEAVSQNDAKASGLNLITSYYKAFSGSGNLGGVSSLVDDYLFKVNQKEITTEKAVETAKDLIVQDQKKKNKNRAKYDVGDVIPTPLGKMKVVGFYDDGEPEVEPF